MPRASRKAQVACRGPLTFATRLPLCAITAGHTCARTSRGNKATTTHRTLNALTDELHWLFPWARKTHGDLDRNDVQIPSSHDFGSEDVWMKSALRTTPAQRAISALR